MVDKQRLYLADFQKPLFEQINTIHYPAHNAVGKDGRMGSIKVKNSL